MLIKNIDAKTLERWLNNDEAILIDVREPAEHEAQKISGSTLIPLSNISKDSLPKNIDKKLVIHCQGGKRSQLACQKLLNEDANLEIYNLQGGILSWIEGGCKINISNKFFLPLDRQVQLTIGLGVFLGSLLGYLVSPKFLLLSGFFGIGLIFAGLSGYCGLAVFMAKMPWNRASKNSISCSIGNK